MTEKDLPSTKPYMVRAIHEWCTDNGFTPYVTVRVDARVRVPKEHVKDGQIVLNIGYEATGGLQIGNDLVSFQARFGGVARELSFPIGNLLAIYARENGAGMAFEFETSEDSTPAVPETKLPESDETSDSGPRTPPPGRPKLQRIK